MTPGGILFVCGALEPGRDGVGDYTRLLAAEMVASGRPCAILAWRDPWVKRPEPTPAPVPSLRLPAAPRGPSAHDAAATFVRAAAPAWVSVQFVPYAYHARGFPLGLPRGVRSLAPAACVHLMVHEPWSDGGRGGRLRRAVFAALHRQAFLAIRRGLAPRATTTTNAAYATLLARAGVAAEVLPLFSNIPVAPRRDGALAAALAAAGAPVPAARTAWRAAALFGSWHRGFDPAAALQDLARASRGQRLVFVSIGGLDPAGEEEFRSHAEAVGPDVACVRLGRLPPDDVSACLHEVDVGFAATPWSLLGKSGGVAAFLEHGVPVVATRLDAPAPALPGTHAYRGPLGAGWHALLAERPPPGSRLPAHAARLAALLPPTP